ncbi:hypothetical protein SAT01_25800 [Sinomonas atrocyanea]|nr:hypothetical protein SAT01_25800 [Sinomonas atrocyanea]GGG58786.1 hypothetical protein GCM10007172_07050 [Sinomonas atrocyanea]
MGEIRVFVACRQKGGIAERSARTAQLPAPHIGRVVDGMKERRSLEDDVRRFGARYRGEQPIGGGNPVFGSLRGEPFANHIPDMPCEDLGHIGFGDSLECRRPPWPQGHNAPLERFGPQCFIQTVRQTAVVDSPTIAHALSLLAESDILG